MTREDALKKIQVDPYKGGNDLLDYCIKKLDFTHEEFESIMNEPVKSFQDYKSYYTLVKKLKRPIRWGTRIGIIPETVFLKYFQFFE
jgi:hypothetical protein